MGVSLERVQFKFASIVGELCSEPDTLSQFAVWLDLRLAEYKLKGAISLDCSGAEPDAVWLKGLKKCQCCGGGKHSGEQTPSQRVDFTENSVSDRNLNTGHNVEHSSSNVSERASSVSQSESHEDMDSISQDVFVIKDEALEVVPVSLHSHADLSRLADDPFSQSFSEPSHPSRLTLSPDNSLTNQSLMSVIGEIDSLDDSGPPNFMSANTSSQIKCESRPPPALLSVSLSSRKRTRRLEPTISNYNTPHGGHGRKLSNAERQKLYRAKMKLTMTEEQKLREKELAKERHQRWKAKHFLLKTGQLK